MKTLRILLLLQLLGRLCCALGAGFPPVPPICADFNQGLPAGTIATGTTPPYVAGGVLHLTDATNSQANYWTTPFPQLKVQSLTARWRTRIGGGTALGADGMSFNLGRDLGTAFTPEEGAGNGLSVTIDTWDNGGTEVGLELRWNGQPVAFTRAGNGSTEAQTPLRPNQFLDTFLEVTLSGVATFTYAGLSVTAQLPNYSGLDANQFVMAARTGGANDNHWIDDVCVTLVPAVVVFDGLAHAPAGNANVSVSSNALRVANIGSSGQDGVSIALGESEGWQGTVEAPLDPNGSRLSWTLRGTVNGTSNLPVSTGRMEVINGEITAFADFSALGASTYRVQAFSNGVLLASAVVPANAAAYRLPAPGRPGPIIIRWEKLIPDNEDPTCSGRWGPPCPVVITNGPVIQANEVRVSPIQASARASSLSRIEFRGAWSAGDLVLHDESVQKFALFHAASGQTQLDLTGDVAVETGLLTAFRQGPGTLSLATDLDHNNALGVGHSPPHALRLSDPGTAVSFALSGKAGNQEGVLGTMAISNLVIHGVVGIPDFNLFLLEVWNGSQLAGSASVPGGALGTLAPQGAGTVSLVGAEMFLTDQGKPAIEYTFASAIRVTDGPAGPLVGERVRCLAAGPGVVDRLSRVFQNWSGFTNVAFFCLLRDYGDAPPGYPVTKLELGASHTYAPNWRLGARFDREFNGVHSANSDWDDLHGVFAYPAVYDDEDGVVVTAAMGTIQVQVTAAVNGFLDGWIDFQRNLNWTDAGDQVAASLALMAGVPTLISVTVPPGTPAGNFFSRWRLSAAGGLSPTGDGGKGEVEDVAINWQPELPLAMDFGDALELGTLFEVTFARDGARHGASALSLGLQWDAEPDGQPSVGAVLDDLTGLADEDGVVFPAALIPGMLNYVQVTVSGGGGVLDAWFDWNNSLKWDLPEHSIAGHVIPAPGVYFVPVNVPPGIPAGQRYARFRFSSLGSALTTGYTLDGEVEDYMVTVGAGGPQDNPNLVLQLSGVPGTTAANQSFGYAATVRNAGLGRATGVSLTVAYPGSVVAGMTALPSQGACQVVSNEVRCTFGPLDPGQSATVQLTATPALQETVRISANASRTEPDVNPQNDRASGLVVIGPLIAQDCACACFTNAPWPSPDPLLRSWYTAGSGGYAQVVTSDGGAVQTSWVGGNNLGFHRSVGPVYADIQKIQFSANAVFVTANGLPSYVAGPWVCARTPVLVPFPNTPLDIPAITRIRRGAIANSAHPVTPLGAMGVWVNGTAVYNMLDGFFYDKASGTDTNPPGLRGIHNRNAYVSELDTFDLALFHQQSDGQYHAHNSPTIPRWQLGDNVTIGTDPMGQPRYIEATNNFHHSPILGWAFDGHPIYGPYGYGNPLDPHSPIQRMRSGYVLRNGKFGTTDLRATGRTTLPAWSICMQGRTSQILAESEMGPDPSTATTTAGCNPISLDLGRYVEDYAYLGDLVPASFGMTWDLDRYNGRCCKTPEFPNGTYAYFVTLDTNGVPAFPYIIGWQYCSETNGNGVVSSIAEPTNVYFEQTDAPTIVSGPEFLGTPGGPQIALVWEGLQGGTYSVETSGNLRTWTALTPTITATSGTTEYRYPRPTPLPDHLFYRVALEALAPFDMQLDPASSIWFRWPASASAGSTVTLTIVLDRSGLLTPPPAHVNPDSVSIGPVPGSFVRTGDIITATFNLPGGMTGSHPLTLVFPLLTLTLTDGFTVK